MITLVQPSGEYQSAFNRINYSIKSDNGNEVGFKFVVKIYDGNNGDLITTCYYDSPADVNEFIEFDVSNFVNSRFDYTDGLPYQGQALGTMQNITKPFYIRCYEYYKVGNDYVIDINSMVESDLKVAIASSFGTLDEINWLPYTQDNCDEGRLPLTDWETQSMYIDEQRTLSVVNNYNTLVDWTIVVNYIDDNTGDPYTDTWRDYPATMGNDYEINNYNVTPTEWQIYGYTMISFTVKATWLSCGGSDNFTWDLQNYTIKRCPRYKSIRIAYLNRWGVFDYFNFDLVSRKSYGIEKKNYKREYSGLIFNNLNQAINIAPTYMVDAKEKWKLTSNYLSSKESSLLSQFYTSPLIYMKMDEYNGRWIPVNIVANSYEIKTVITDKLFNIEVELELAYLNKRQSL